MSNELVGKVRAFMALWGNGESNCRPDVDAILAMMSEDAEWQLWVPGGPKVSGKTALRAEILRQMTFAGSNKCNEVNIAWNGNIVMQERSDEAVINGRPCPHQMVAIYEFDDDGLIRKWREYLDMEDLNQKMGVGDQPVEENQSLKS